MKYFLSQIHIMILFVSCRYFIYKYFIKNYKEIISIDFLKLYYIFVELCFSASPALDTLF